MMRRLLAKLSLRGGGSASGDRNSEGNSSSDEETDAMIAEINYSESIKPMTIATNMQLPIYSNSNLAPDSNSKYYCANSMQYVETSHLYAALVGNEIYYFPSDYMGVTNRKQLLCCKLTSSLKDKAADTIVDNHQDFRVTTEIFNTNYTSADDVKQENNVLFRALCTDEDKHLVYIYGGSIFTFERTPTNNFHVFDAKKKLFSRIEMQDAEQLPKLEGHTLIQRDSDTFYTFGGLHDKEFCNKIFEFNIKTMVWREVVATNHDMIKARSYHVGQYVKKFDVMVIVSGKLRVGPSAPMTNEILIYHFRENRFQIINSSPTPFYNIPAHHVIHSCRLSDNQFAFYGGCQTTDYSADDQYDPNLFILTFNNRNDKKSTDLTPVVSVFDLQERTSSCYTTIVYHKKFKCFVLLGANASQRKDQLSFFYLDAVSYTNPIEAFVNMKSILDFEYTSKFQDVTIHSH